MESIYNLVPEEYDPVKFGDKGPMYRSRYDPKAGVTGSTVAGVASRTATAPMDRLFTAASTTSASPRRAR